MRAISLWQPWASLVAQGAKQYETRSWSTSYRGKLAIHAAKRFTAEEIRFCRMSPFREVLAKGGITRSIHVPLGKVLCVVELEDVLRTEEVEDVLSDQELAFGNYAPGRFAWRLRVVEVFDPPIAAKGMQGIWEWRR